MPMQKGAKPGTPGFGRNIAAEEKAGKPPAQAEAIAYSEAKSTGDSFPVEKGLTLKAMNDRARDAFAKPKCDCDETKGSEEGRF